MPVGVVERLEMVEIAEHQRTELARTRAADQRAAQMVEQVGAVGQISERIVERQPEYLVFVLLALADIGTDRHDLVRGAVAVAGVEQGPAAVDMGTGAVPPAVAQFAAPFAFGQRGVVSHPEGGCVLVQELLQALALGLAGAPSVQPFRPAVPVGDSRFKVEHDDGVARLVEQRGLFKQLQVGLPDPGEVDDEALDGADAAIIANERGAGFGHPLGVSACVNDAVSKLIGLGSL